MKAVPVNLNRSHANSRHFFFLLSSCELSTVTTWHFFFLSFFFLLPFMFSPSFFLLFSFFLSANIQLWISDTSSYKDWHFCAALYYHPSFHTLACLLTTLAVGGMYLGVNFVISHNYEGVSSVSEFLCILFTRVRAWGWGSVIEFLRSQSKRGRA